MKQLSWNTCLVMGVEGFASQSQNAQNAIVPGENSSIPPVATIENPADTRARTAASGWRFRDRYGLDVRFEKP